jgi:hypothetical protein
VPGASPNENAFSDHARPPSGSGTVKPFAAGKRWVRVTPPASVSFTVAAASSG